MDLPTVEAVVPGDETDWRPGDCWLAGGTVLFSRPQQGVRRLRDLTVLGWPSLAAADDEGRPGLDIAATCTVATLARYRPPARWPDLAEAIRRCCDAFLSSWKIWNVATVGGNLCAALPAGPMISLAAAFDARCDVRRLSGERRLVPVDAFVVEPGVAALQPGEYLRAIHLPERELTGRIAVRRASLHPLGRSAAFVTGHLDVESGRLRLTVTAATPRPVTVSVPAPTAAASLVDMVDAQVSAEGWHDDVHGLPAWRRHMTLRLVEQVRADLLGAAR
ncbi:FAD binding domain-containing protein [Micromonospora sp. CPCC 206060]|uniref:FAD binding domain-containing protein n=1 Tax=Micromonospora sp. CPCC 206060 TaxID=3122406 RepID=UPI002FF18002